MHVPKEFEVTDQKIIEAFIDDHGFATLVSANDGLPIATHIPLELVHDEHGNRVLWGHVSRANPQWHSFVNEPRVLVIFLSSLHHYISSSWYAQPNAPTWNYESVHVYGTVRIITGDKLWQSVKQLTDKYEKNSAQPVSLDTLPTSVQRMMQGLVGFEISVDEIEAISKLSQGRDRTDRENIIKQLKEFGSPQAQMMADRMERTLHEG